VVASRPTPGPTKTASTQLAPLLGRKGLFFQDGTIVSAPIKDAQRGDEVGFHARWNKQVEEAGILEHGT
jgi:hypothetical protein